MRENCTYGIDEGELEIEPYGHYASSLLYKNGMLRSGVKNTQWIPKNTLCIDYEITLLHKEQVTGREPLCQTPLLPTGSGFSLTL